MGIYWKWICRADGSELSPDDFEEGVKHPENAPRTLRAVALMLMYSRRWKNLNVELISDASGGNQDDFYEERSSVAEEARALLREHFPEGQCHACRVRFPNLCEMHYKPWGRG